MMRITGAIGKPIKVDLAAKSADKERYTLDDLPHVDGAPMNDQALPVPETDSGPIFEFDHIQKRTPESKVPVEVTEST
ncbi:hypothetical protein PIB30_025377 [Stylosanthes scabra]|uniref:Uncharacterized protein n=1 Tax=Stylosanthes scabra TaxID=79078 RepID=A0ABU6Z8E3_9FABA|nr:hypothetical protein [Stylosanthes scabra]